MSRFSPEAILASPEKKALCEAIEEAKAERLRERRQEFLDVLRQKINYHVLAAHQIPPGFWDEYKERSEKSAFLDLMLGVPYPDNGYEEAVGIIKDYHDAAEACDRRYPHTPSPYSPKAVYMIPTWEFMKQRHHDEIRELVRLRNERLSAIELDRKDQRYAEQEGLRRHEDELEPCNCWSCVRLRGEIK